MAAVCTFIGATPNTANQSSYTFSSHAIGTPSADRHVIVLVALQQQGGGAPITPTVTVAGQSCTSVATINAAAERINIFITDAPVTTGTTADIVVNEGSTQHGCFIGIYTATGLGSTTPTATLTDDTDPLSGSINCNAGGFVIGLAQTVVNGATWTWAGITEDFDGDFDTFEPTGAHTNFAGAQTGLTVSATPTSFTRGLMAVAAFKPANQIEGVLASESSLTANVNRTAELNGALAAVSVLEAELVTNLIKMEGALAAVSAFSASISHIRYYAGDLAAFSALEANFEKLKGIEGLLAAISFLQGALLEPAGVREEFDVIKPINIQLTAIKPAPIELSRN